MAPRSTGSAVLWFGRVAIPVKLYKATDDEAPSGFHQLHAACSSRVKQVYLCPNPKCATGEGAAARPPVVAQADMVKGYEVAKDQFVTFTKDELEQLEEGASSAIDLAEYVPLSSVDPAHYDKPHHLAPAPGAERAYVLFATALKRAGKAGLGRFAKGGRQLFVMVRPGGAGLVLQQLLRAEQVRPATEIPVVAAVVQEPELELAAQLIEQKSSEAFRADAYPDEVKVRTLALIEEKRASGKIVTSPAKDDREVIVDLLEALKASVKTGRRGPHRAARVAPRAAEAERSRSAARK